MSDDSRSTRRELKETHTPRAVAERLAAPASHSYLRDFVYGAIDGAVTTFAVVSGVAGAELSGAIVLVLGMANLVGDGFSMAASNYLGSRAERQQLGEAGRARVLTHHAWPNAMKRLDGIVERCLAPSRRLRALSAAP